MADEAKSAEYGEIATRLLFENAKVKVWEMRLEPGQATELHEHHHDNVLIQISGDRVAVEPDPATRGEYNEYLEADVFPGNVIYVEKGGIEKAVNIGKQEYYEIIVELKD